MLGLAPRQYSALWIAAVMMGGFLGPLTNATAQARLRQREYDIKLAYLYNFCRYIEWPVSEVAEDGPYRIGILGDSPFGASLDQLAERKTINGRKIVVRRFDSWQRYRPCHVLFVVGTVDPRQAQEAIDGSRGQPVLVVGETPGFAAQGAPVGLFVDTDTTIGFEVNLDAFRRQGLRASAALLKLAVVVREGPQVR